MTVPPSSGDTHRAPARSDVLAALVALGQDLAGSVTPDRVAAAVAATLHALLDPDALFIVLVDAGGRRAVAHADGVSDPRPDHPLVERVLAEGPLLDARDQHGSWLAVPLRSAEPLGAVCLGLRTPGRFGQDELRLVTAVASQAATVLMPQQRFEGDHLHEDLAEMAAAYLFHIVQNHAFHDGNKRTGALAALVFLDVNGVGSLPAPGDLEAMTRAVAAGEAGKDDLTAWMRGQLE